MSPMILVTHLDKLRASLQEQELSRIREDLGVVQADLYTPSNYHDTTNRDFAMDKQNLMILYQVLRIAEAHESMFLLEEEEATIPPAPTLENSTPQDKPSQAISSLPEKTSQNNALIYAAAILLGLLVLIVFRNRT